MLDPHLIASTRPKALAENMIIHGPWRVTLLTDCLFRLEKSETAQFEDRATQHVWYRDFPAVAHHCTEEPHDFSIITDACILKLGEQEVTFLSRKGAFPETTLSDLMQVEKLPGTCRTLDGCDGLTHLSFRGGKVFGDSVSLEDAIVTRSGIGFWDDQDALLLTDEGQLVPRTGHETDLYVFAYGTDYRGAIKALYRLTGFPPMLPRFALGNWWSRYYPYSDREYLDLMDDFKDREIPFTVATIDMDWHLTEDLPEGEDGWTGYTWNSKLFPDYRAFLQALHARGLKVTLNLHPALGIRAYEAMYPAMADAMGVDPLLGETIPFDITSERFLRAYFSVLHKPYERDGVDFWWIDWQQGTKSAVEGADPLWSLNHYHFLDIQKEKDGLILSRYAGLGSHRYPVGFSGDTVITWDTLKIMPLFTSSATNTGYTWWSHDIGGHMLGYKDDELYVRFVQFGVFSPILRLHSTNNRLVSKDPQFYGSGKGSIAAHYLRLRHRLIPMLYTASVRNHDDGLAMIEPMYYAWGQQEEAYHCPDQYLFMQSMIASPITEHSDAQGLVVTRVWLPAGKWTDVFSRHTYQGDRWVEMVRDLASFPLLAHEGSFLVLDATRHACVEACNRVDLPENLEVQVFSGEGSYTLIEDGPCGRDGKPTRATTCFSVQKDATQPTGYLLSMEVHDPDHIIQPRRITFILRDVLEGEVCLDPTKTSLPVRYRQGSTQVVVDACEDGQRLLLRYADKATEQEKRLSRLEDVLLRLEMDNRVKEQIFEKLSPHDTLLDWKAELSMFTLPRSYVCAILEVL